MTGSRDVIDARPQRLARLYRRNQFSAVVLSSCHATTNLTKPGASSTFKEA